VYALDFREYVCNSKHKRNVLSKKEREKKKRCLLLLWVALILKFESLKDRYVIPCRLVLIY